MTTESVYVPLELMLEILFKLPAKTLLRFRLVCKSWFSLISSNKFATLHFDATARKLVFIKRKDPKFLSVDVDAKFLSIDVDASLHDDSVYSSLGVSYSTKIYDASTCAFLRTDYGYLCDVRIRGLCRGFLLLHSGAYFYVWNPSTKVIKKIPEYCRSVFSDNPMFGGSKDIALFGLTYDRSADDYLIVSWFFDGVSGTRSREFLIFSLKANKWKSIEGASHFPHFPYRMTAGWENDPKRGLFLNGSIHWRVYNRETSKNVIVAFDIKDMMISEIALPDDSYIEYDLLVVEGLISAWMKDVNAVKIWVMQKYAVHSSWTKIIELSVDPALHSGLSIVCITDCGDIIGIDGEGRLVKFNEKGKLLDHPFCHNHRLKRSESVLYKESLFSLPGTGQA